MSDLHDRLDAFMRDRSDEQNAVESAAGGMLFVDAPPELQVRLLNVAKGTLASALLELKQGGTEAGVMDVFGAWTAAFALGWVFRESELQRAVREE